MTKEDFNSVKLIGRLGKDPETRYTGAGIPITTVSIAVGGGEKKNGDKWPTHWIDIKAFKEVAETLGKLNKGSQIQLKGELNQESWTKDGAKKSKVVVLVRELEDITRERGSKSVKGDYDTTAEPF